MRWHRRKFLQASLGSSAVMALGTSLPDFLRHASAAETEPRDTILVVLQLSGGNDGLNTVIPAKDERYQRARPQLAIPPDETLAINDELGFHPSLRGFADLLEAGRLCMVQGVGYDNPNRSHFESMDIWHTCQRKNQTRNTGWIGRSLDQNRIQVQRDAAAIHLGNGKQPLALAAERVRVPSIQSLERFRLQDGGETRIRETIAELTSSKRETADPLLDFLQTSTTAALSASQRVEEARQSYQPAVRYPDSELADRLQTVAQLIDAEFATRVYYTEIDGFDTHAQQAAVHANLLEQTGDATHAFLEDLQAKGHGDRVVVMAFSEFGRRVQENASEGTDHGAAAPLFLAGNAIQPGLVGDHPSLSDLDQGDLKYHTDFREVYATLLDQWLGWSSKAVLGNEFKNLSIL